MTTAEIVASILTDIINSALHDTNIPEISTPTKIDNINDEESFIGRYCGGNTGSYMKNKLLNYQKEACELFKSETLKVVPHLSSIEKFVRSSQKDREILEKPTTTTKPEEPFMMSAKRHKSKVMEEKELFESAKRLIMREEAPVKRSYLEMESQNYNPNMLVTLTSKAFCMDNIDPIPEANSRLEDDGGNRPKYVIPKNPKKLNLSNVKPKIDTNIR